MTINSDKLCGFNEKKLAEYLWKRLRYEELDPPIEYPLVTDSPEGFIIRVLRESQDPDFKARLVNAIKNNLADLSINYATQPLDLVSDEQLANLAFLAAATENEELATALYMIACAFFIESSGKSPVSIETLYHLLRAVARLQSSKHLTPFWNDICQHQNPSLRSVAYYGLSLADSEKAMQLLKKMITDEDVDLSMMLWHLATESPGLENLCKEVAALPNKLQRKTRTALAEAISDTNDQVITDFDQYIDKYKKETSMQKSLIKHGFQKLAAWYLDPSQPLEVKELLDLVNRYDECGKNYIEQALVAIWKSAPPSEYCWNLISHPPYIEGAANSYFLEAKGTKPILIKLDEVNAEGFKVLHSTTNSMQVDSVVPLQKELNGGLSQ